jgi:hypothetical protein
LSKASRDGGIAEILFAEPIENPDVCAKKRKRRRNGLHKKRLRKTKNSTRTL